MVLAALGQKNNSLEKTELEARASKNQWGAFHAAADID